MRKLAATLFLISVGSPLSAQWLDWRSPLVPRNADGSPEMSAPAPRTADDRVDLTGLWVPERARGSVFDESLLLGWALEAMVENEADFYSNDPRFHCLPSGPSFLPAGPSAGGTRQILQHLEIIAILHSDMTYRQIYMDGRELEPDPVLRTWMGYSTGRWDGDTLVVESNGYNDKTWLIREGLPHSDQLRITERYTRLDYGHMELEISYVDPGTFTGPVQATVDLVLTPDSALLEVVCNESETGTRHYSGEIEQAEEKVVDVPIEVLERYVGTYQGIWLGNLITAEVTLEGSELYLTRTPRYSDTGGNTDFDTSRLIPLSENAFDSLFGLGWVFNVNEDGEVTSVSEVHVSGAWPFERLE
ncbi:MAG TPA: hypothetical protein VMR74_16080 [Gammaproteobacteria bacterium]|nr:hypothetical protein [Gammaproteobacteria bacterium]